MSLIPTSDLTTLISASEAKAVADSAEDTILEMQAAACINTAANTGEHLAVWQHEMPDSLKTKLEGEGYQVLSDNSAADPTRRWIIGGF